MTLAYIQQGGIHFFIITISFSSWDLFVYWENLVHLRRPPGESSSSAQAIPAGTQETELS